MEGFMGSETGGTKPVSTQPQERKVLKPILSPDEIKKPKKSVGQKFKETFIAEDVNKVKDHVIKDVVVPGLKGIILDASIKGLKSLLGMSNYPTNGGYRTGTTWGNVYNSWAGYTGYQAYQRQQQEQQVLISNKNRDPQPAINDRAIYKWDNIIVCGAQGDTPKVVESKAQSIIDELFGIQLTYGKATLLDLYELVGFPHTPDDYNYGWFDLTGLHKEQTAGGWILRFPSAPVSVK